MFLMRKTIFSTIQFYLTHVSTQGHSARIESVKWSHQEMPREADILRHVLYTASSIITFSYRYHIIFHL